MDIDHLQEHITHIVWKQCIHTHINVEAIFPFTIAFDRTLPFVYVLVYLSGWIKHKWESGHQFDLMFFFNVYIFITNKSLCSHNVSDTSSNVTFDRMFFCSLSISYRRGLHEHSLYKETDRDYVHCPKEKMITYWVCVRSLTHLLFSFIIEQWTIKDRQMQKCPKKKKKKHHH